MELHGSTMSNWGFLWIELNQAERMLGKAQRCLKELQWEAQRLLIAEGAARGARANTHGELGPQLGQGPAEGMGAREGRLWGLKLTIIKCKVAKSR